MPNCQGHHHLGAAGRLRMILSQASPPNPPRLHLNEGEAPHTNPKGEDPGLPAQRREADRHIPAALALDPGASRPILEAPAHHPEPGLSTPVVQALLLERLRNSTPATVRHAARRSSRHHRDVIANRRRAQGGGFVLHFPSGLHLPDAIVGLLGDLDTSDVPMIEHMVAGIRTEGGAGPDQGRHQGVGRERGGMRARIIGIVMSEAGGIRPRQCLVSSLQSAREV